MLVQTFGEFGTGVSSRQVVKTLLSLGWLDSSPHCLTSHVYTLTAHAEAQQPRFVDQLKNLTVREGDPVVLSAEASGVPLPMMAWQKDGRMIPSNDKTYKVSASAS